MRYIKAALLTIVLCIVAIIFGLVGVSVLAQATNEKPKVVRSYIEDTTPLDVSIYIENSDKVVRLSIPRNMRSGFVYPGMKEYTKNTADRMKERKSYDEFVQFYLPDSSQTYFEQLNAKSERSEENNYGEYEGLQFQGRSHAEYEGLQYQGRIYSDHYYHGDISSISCFGSDEPRRVVYVCSGFFLKSRVCAVYSPSTADGFYFNYIANEKFLTEWQTLHNKTCGLLRSFVVK
jgi:hypothetical protein